MVENGFDINQKIKDENYLLTYAIKHNQFDLMTVLLQCPSIDISSLIQSVRYVQDSFYFFPSKFDQLKELTYSKCFELNEDNQTALHRAVQEVDLSTVVFY